MRTLGVFLLPALLTACTMEQEVELTNATDQEIAIDERISTKHAKGTFTITIAPRGTKRTARHDAKLAISSGNRTRYYPVLRVPDAYTANDHSFSLFRTRIAQATLRKDGCIHLAPLATGQRAAGSAQPTGFPLCPHKEIVDPPPAPREPTPPAASELLAFATQAQAWTCPVSAGGEHIRPLYELEHDDRERIQQARERVELSRRVSFQTWDVAFADFARQQSDFHDTYRRPDFSKQTFIMLAHAGAEGRIPARRLENFAGSYDMFRNDYVRYCEARNGLIRRMMADDAALAALRQESPRPWLDETKRIPCRVAAVRRCKAD